MTKFEVPFFSIIIPAFNADSTIANALESIVEQTFTNYEVIIINDCSTDNTNTIITQYKKKIPQFHVIENQQNIGVAESRNKGITFSKGMYIAFLDSDDIWHRKKLSAQAQCIRDTSCDICCTSYNFIDASDKHIKNPYMTISEIKYEDLLKENYIGLSTAVVNKSLFNSYKMSNEYYHEDYALWLQLVKSGAKVVGLNEVLVSYRVSKNTRSSNKLLAAVERFKIYRKQEKISFISSVKYIILYTINGLRKYYAKK